LCSVVSRTTSLAAVDGVKEMPAPLLASTKLPISQRSTISSLPAVRMHGAQLQQLFLNLIGNAIKYRSPERTPEIHIAAERQGRGWTFTVADNGIGIPPEYKEQVFGLFKRLHTSEEYSGTGLGLAICQRIVDQHNGRIWVDSEPGRGSAFHFTIPQRGDDGELSDPGRRG